MTVTGPAQAATPPRPKGVTAVAALSIVQGVLVVLLGVALIVSGVTPDAEVESDLTGAAALATGVCVVVLGLIECVLAVWLARGNDRVRSIFGIVNTVHVAIEIYVLVALRDLKVASIWSLLLPVGVLWLLYGSQAAQDYFAR